MTQVSDLRGEAAPVIIVPCARGDQAGCEIVHRAVGLVAEQTPELVVLPPEDCPERGRRFVVAVDSCRACQASAALEACGVRPSAVISAPEVLSRRGLVRPGVDVRAEVERLSQALAEAIQESLGEVLEEVRERRRYREGMAPILQRFGGIWEAVEALSPPPNGAPSEQERKRVELLGKRSRNLFQRFDEVVPPEEDWSEPHDLFQDALLCIAYACEGWVSGDAARWEQNLEKARVQIRPLLRRLQ